jgi:hypothetical protein
MQLFAGGRAALVQVMVHAFVHSNPTGTLKQAARQVSQQSEFLLKPSRLLIELQSIAMLRRSIIVVHAVFTQHFFTGLTAKTGVFGDTMASSHQSSIEGICKRLPRRHSKAKTTLRTWGVQLKNEGQPLVSRITSRVGSNVGSTASPSTRRMSESTRARPAMSICWRTVVSGGWKCAASSISS